MPTVGPIPSWWLVFRPQIQKRRRRKATWHNITYKYTEHGLHLFYYRCHLCSVYLNVMLCQVALRRLVLRISVSSLTLCFSVHLTIKDLNWRFMCLFECAGVWISPRIYFQRICLMKDWKPLISVKEPKERVLRKHTPHTHTHKIGRAHV